MLRFSDLVRKKDEKVRISVWCLGKRKHGKHNSNKNIRTINDTN